MKDSEIADMVAIVQASRTPMTSVEVAASYSEKVGSKHDQSWAYRRLLKAAADGRLVQNGKRRWTTSSPATPQTTPQPEPCPKTSAPPDDRMQTASELFRKTSDALASGDRENASFWKRLADTAYAGI